MQTADDIYYYFLRCAAREKVAGAINQKVKDGQIQQQWSRITFSSIGRAEIDYARLEWPKHYSASVHNGLPYSWEKLLFRFCPKPSYFDLAIWQQIGETKILQGLALGRPSNGKRHLVINWIERSFGSDYLKMGVLLPILSCAEEYAKLIGAERVLIKDPINEHEFGRYGYHRDQRPKGAGVYLSKELIK